MDSLPIQQCLACAHTTLVPCLDLGEQPLANSFYLKGETLPKYPLAVNHCESCFHLQLSVAVKPEALFSNYLYVSGTTKTLMSYFDEFVERVEKRSPGRKLKVLDIASNDGSLLEKFKDRGHEVLGVDPAENLQPLSKSRGVPTECAFWSHEFAQSLGKKFDIVIAMNVVAHVADPSGFLKGIAEVLEPNGLAYIQTSQSEMIRNFEFDTIYHEHHSFFNSRSFERLCERSHCHLIAVDKVPVHGTSYLWMVSKDKSARTSTVTAMQAEETSLGYFKNETYVNFARKASQIAQTVYGEVQKFREKGFAIVGYGAAAKGNTFVNFAHLDLDYVVDDNPLKVGLLSPGMGATVKASSELSLIGDRPAFFVVLAWNFYKEVKSRIQTVRNDRRDGFLTYFPEVKVEHSV